ncbi:MAG: sigma-70 family RNA polymerase sigma factor [Acidobacteria bacterium]|nr:sigma-70 family RNA polymerase sigma factor [Acidobacteriota bacterium]
MVAYLTRIFGLNRLGLAEDVVQDTLCRAIESWPTHGVPANPSAWLMRAARNRAIDILRRDEQFRVLTPELVHLVNQANDDGPDPVAFESEIRDDQLRMMFSCCHPDLSTDAQVTLILKTLCGFSVSEIAHALLANEDSIEKRLGRARTLLRQSGATIELTSLDQIPERLEAVYQAIYLLFNEGYHSSRSEQTVREDLCFEAIRLALLLSEHPACATPKTHALLSLLCFHAARLSGRLSEDGSLLQLEMQDRSRWDQHLMARGSHFLEKAMTGTQISDFHFEAMIAAMHCAAPEYEATDWRNIARIYNNLYDLRPTPVVALNRAIARGKLFGPDQGLAELNNIPDIGKLKDYPFYAAAQGEFHLEAGRPAEAAAHFENAIRLARNPSEALFFENKRSQCE